MLHFGTRVLTTCPLPGGRLVAHGQSVYPCHEDGIQFGPYLTTALDEVGCDVSLSWVGLGWVVLWLGGFEIYSLQEYFEPKYSSKEKPERAYTF